MIVVGGIHECPAIRAIHESPLHGYLRNAMESFSLKGKFVLALFVTIFVLEFTCRRKAAKNNSAKSGRGGIFMFNFTGTKGRQQLPTDPNGTLPMPSRRRYQAPRGRHPAVRSKPILPSMHALRKSRHSGRRLHARTPTLT